MPRNLMLEGHERSGLTWNTMIFVDKNLPHHGAILIFSWGCISEVENVTQCSTTEDTSSGSRGTL